jgi:peptide/nickel transport system substrate-binding protein
VVFSLEDNELVFKLKEPFSPFLSVVSKPIFKKGLIGLGEYKISKILKKGKYIKSITLTAFDKDNKNLPAKTYKFYNSENELKTAFNLGEINRLDNLFDTSGINLSKNIKTEQVVKKNIYLAVFINNAKPFLEVKSFRQALAYATPKQDDQLRAIGPINPLSWAYNPDIKPYSFDLERAKSLLGEDKEASSSLKLSLTTFPQYQQLAQAIKESWEKLGITTELKITTFLPSDFDTLLIAREIPLEPDQYYFWHTTQAGNLINFKNPRIDKLLEDGRKTIDPQARKDIYYDFQRFLAEESPVIFLSYPLVYTVSRN